MLFALVDLAEAEGFEPPDPCGSLAFKARKDLEIR